MLIILYTGDCLLYARDKTYIDSFVKTLHYDYKLTLNDPYPIDDFLGIYFSHQDIGELHMSQTGLIDAVTESAHIPKGRLKNTPTPATSIFTLTQKELHDKNPLTTHPLSDNLTTLHKTRDQTYHSLFTNAHDSLKNRKHCTKKQSNASYTTCNAQETNYFS
jgi:hypothetical protein